MRKRLKEARQGLVWTAVVLWILAWLAVLIIILTRA